MKTYDAKANEQEWSIEIDDTDHILNLNDAAGKYVCSAHPISRKSERQLIAQAFDSGATHVRCAYDLVRTDGRNDQ